MKLKLSEVRLADEKSPELYVEGIPVPVIIEGSCTFFSDIDLYSDRIFIRTRDARGLYYFLCYDGTGFHYINRIEKGDSK